MEDYHAMETRHQLELQQLQETAKTMLKGAKKSAKAQLEAQIIQMEYDLKAKHREEMDALEENLGQEVVEAMASASIQPVAPSVESTEKSEEEIAKAKKAKAKKKQVKLLCILHERERGSLKHVICGIIGQKGQQREGARGDQATDSQSSWGTKPTRSRITDIENTTSKRQLDN